MRRVSKNCTKNSRRIWIMSDALNPSPGRKPPPAEHQFLKGTSGNKRGRPKGSRDLKKITRKVALKKHAVKVNGKTVRKTLLQLVVELTAREAAAGAPAMVVLVGQVRAKVRPSRGRAEGRFPPRPRRSVAGTIPGARRSSKRQQARTGTYVDHKAEEFMKAARGDIVRWARPCWPSINAGVRDAPDQSPVPLAVQPRIRGERLMSVTKSL